MTTNCIHHWIIPGESVTGEAEGVCKHCGASRMFPTWSRSQDWKIGGNTIGGLRHHYADNPTLADERMR